MFYYWCPHCPQKLHAEPKHVGYRARCPRCGKVHAVPDPEDPFLVGQDDPQGTRSNLARDAAAAAAAKPQEPGDPFARFKKPAEADGPKSNVFRRCGSCKRVVSVDNEWAGVLCRYCGAEIPGA